MLEKKQPQRGNLAAVMRLVKLTFFMHYGKTQYFSESTLVLKLTVPADIVTKP